MHLRITSDGNAESGVGEIVDEISGPTRKLFRSKDYGPGLLGIVVVLMCRNPDLNFKRRIRLSQKDDKLFMDIMLDLVEMKSATVQLRRHMIIQRIVKEIPEVINKYSLKDFDAKQFYLDLKAWEVSQIRN